MANEDEDDDYYFGNDDIDDDMLAVLEQAEKLHATQAPTASQQPPLQSQRKVAASSAYANVASRAPGVPVQQPYNARFQPQKQTSAHPFSQTAVNRSASAGGSQQYAPSPQQQHQQPSRQQHQPTNRSVPPPQASQSRNTSTASTSYGHNANARAGPSNSHRYARVPQKPTYKDEFPNVDVDETGYKPRNSKSTLPTLSSQNGSTRPAAALVPDNEKTQLQQQLEELKRTLEEERKLRYTKEGEVNILRNAKLQAEKVHQEALIAETSRIAPLQNRVSALEAALQRESSKHNSELVFQKNEIESKFRHTNGAGGRSAKKLQGSQQQNNTQKNAVPLSSQLKRSPKQPPAPKVPKGFQNSFFESSTLSRRKSPGRLPSSPSERMAHGDSPSRKDKGKQKEAQPTYPDADFNDLPDITFDMDSTRDQGSFSGDDDDLSRTLHTSFREEITIFLFDHVPHVSTQRTSTLHRLINPTLPDSVAVDHINAHRVLSQRLFQCLGHKARESSSEGEQDSNFIWSVIEVLMDFSDFFAQITLRDYTMLSLDMVHDLALVFPNLVFSLHTSQESYEAILGKVFKTLRTIIQRDRADVEAKYSPLKNTTAGKKEDAATRSANQAKRGDQLVFMERQHEEYFCAILLCLQILALGPDQHRLAHFDAFLRDSTCLAFFLDSRRRPVVHSEALLLTTLLSCPTPFQSDLNGQSRSVAANGLSSTTQQLMIVEHTASFLSYRNGDPAQNLAIQQLALVALSTLATVHADGTPLLSQSPSLVQRLIMRLAHAASVLYDASEPPLPADDLTIFIRSIEASMRLLFHLILSQEKLKTLASHIADRPVARDYLVAGVGRIACTEVPDWLEDRGELAPQLDQLANVGFELLEDVLSPDELDDLYALCRDDDEQAEADVAAVGVAGEEDEEEMAAQNVHDMES